MFFIMLYVSASWFTGFMACMDKDVSIARLYNVLPKEIHAVRGFTKYVPALEQYYVYANVFYFAVEFFEAVRIIVVLIVLHSFPRVLF
jgi:hypothetical protein